MILIFLILVLLVVVFGPGIWVSRVIDKYSVPADRYSGTGGDLARYLLDKRGLTGVAVETTEHGDHYDPEAKAVRLTDDKFGGRSLTAITVAAHEVGHAIQDHEGYGPLRVRTKLVKGTQWVQKLGAGILMISPASTMRPGSHLFFSP